MLNVQLSERMARGALDKALAGRAVVDLPKPEEVVVGARPHARWDMDGFVVTALAMSVGPRVNIRGGPLLWADEAETRGAALIAAAREARRIAGGVGGDTQ